LEEKRTSKYIVQQLLYEPEMGSSEYREMYRRFAKRVLWIDGGIVPGAFQMNTSWYCKVPERNPVFDEHSHACDELIGFFSGDPERPYELGAQLEVWLDGERHVITRSCMIFVPANMKHMPLKFDYVDRPVFHFSVVMNERYDGDAYRHGQDRA